MTSRLLLIRPKVFILLAALVALPSQAALRKVLVPVVIAHPTAGAFGSTWATQITILNKNALGIIVDGALPPCSFDPCIQPPIAPSRSTTVNPLQGDVTGKFFFVPEEVAKDVIVKLRVFDMSRSDTNYGTEIPVIDETHASAGTIELLDVAATPEFRSLVRIYDFDPAQGHQARVRIFLPSNGFDEDLLLSELTLPLRTSANVNAYPGYAELSLSTVTGLPASGRVRVEVTPLGTAMRLWSFASVTNNATQHVTIVTP